MKQFTKIADEKGTLSEGPIWDYKNNVLYWTDIIEGVLFRTTPESSSYEKLIEGKNIGGFALNETGGLVCACWDGFYFWTENDGFSLIATEHEGISLRFNDTTTDAKGRFYAGSAYIDPDNPNFQRGKLYQLNNDASIRVLEENLDLANGMGFSPDNHTFYLTDCVKREIYAYDYDLDSGLISNKRLFVKVQDSEGIPDGMTVDSNGNVWSAQWYGQCIVQYSPSGQLLQKIETPMKQTSSLIFGGKNFEDLYITTAAGSWKSPYAPAGYDYNATNIGGPVYRTNVNCSGKKEYYANINKDK